jgi:hypothetical protein
MVFELVCACACVECACVPCVRACVPARQEESSTLHLVSSLLSSRREDTSIISVSTLPSSHPLEHTRPPLRLLVDALHL